MPRRNRPSVKDGVLLTDGAEPITIGTREWFAWLAEHGDFIYRDGTGHFSARRETRRGLPYWYAYRWRGGKLGKTYLGKSDGLTRERLEHAGARLTGETKLPSPDSILWANSVNASPGAALDLAFLPLTKLRPPALPQNLVTRPRLTRRLDAPVVLLIAPSGFGKSTLLNEWRQTCGMPVAWVSLDPEDNQPLRFWSTVTAAVQTVYPHLSAPSAPHLSESVGLTNAIVRAGEQPSAPSCVALVLDDYHSIQDKEIHNAVQAWIEHLPPNLRLVISSHTQPALSCGRLRARGMMTQLDADDLRFTLEEGIGYLTRHVQGRRLAYGEMQTIVKRTEGWAAGLALAVHMLDRPGQPPSEAFSGAHSYLREYFIESILYRQPPTVQEFLLETAILKHLTGSLCDAVTGRTDGAEMLAYLWQENLFLVRMEEPGWYRYHDLFAETLCTQLQRQLATGIPRLHRRAAEWYRKRNAPADAVYHLLAIQDWEQAAALIESMALRELEEFGDYARLLRWLQQLPETVMQQHKTLLRVYVRVAALTLSRTEMNQFLTRVETNIRNQPAPAQSAEEQAVLEEIAQIRALWMRDNAGLSLLSPAGEHDDVWRMLDGIIALARLLRHEYAQAEALAQELYDLAQRRRHLYVMLIAGGILAVHVLLDGYLRRSDRIARELLEQVMAQCGKLPEPASIALLALTQGYYERNELTQAHQLLLRASEVDPNPSSSNMPIMEALLRAKVQSAQGDGAAALATLQVARELQARSPSGIYRERDLVVYQAWVCMRQRDYAGAERFLDEAGARLVPATRGGADGEPGATRRHSLAAFVWAELLLTQGQPAAAAEVLASLVQAYPGGFYFEPILGARVLLATALLRQSQVNAARQVMADAVRLAAPENFLRPFLDYGRDAVPLLTLVLHSSKLTLEAQAFARKAVALLGQAPSAPAISLAADLSALSTAASITPREQQILHLVTAGLANQEIAVQLSCSESTVKTHLKNIYRKLDVNSRTRAVAQARALKLV